MLRLWSAFSTLVSKVGDNGVISTKRIQAIVLPLNLGFFCFVFVFFSNKRVDGLFIILRPSWYEYECLGQVNYVQSALRIQLYRLLSGKKTTIGPPSRQHTRVYRWLPHCP